MFLGIDWMQVDWTDVAKLFASSLMLTAVVLLAIRILPFVPTARKKLFYFFALLLIWTPIGLITPGVAFGEWVPEQGFDKLPGVGYLPQGLDALSRLWKAPLQFYKLPWVTQTAPISGQAPGYIVSGTLGVVAVVGVTWLLGKLLSRREKSDRRPNN